MGMDIKRRGYLETAIDEQLMERRLKTYFDLFSELSPKIGFLEDAIFGFIIGNTYANYSIVYRDLHNGDFTNEDVELFIEITKRRTLEMKSRIREIGNL
jgi:hypothetical protein